MKIAILEICTYTHYSAINGLIKTYSVNPDNIIVVYTNNPVAKALRENGITENTTIVVLEDEKNVAPFLNMITDTHYDRLHICTIENHYQEFDAFRPNVDEIVFHVHNIDIWFDNDVKNNIKNLFFTLKGKTNNVRTVGGFVKDILIRNPKRASILARIQHGKHKFIVHSEGQKGYLSEFVPAENIIVFPFAINEGIITNAAPRVINEKIRICIPGIVTDTRRDYTGLSKILDEILVDIKDRLTFDFLGFVKKGEPELFNSIRNLEKRGLDLIYYTEFVFGKKFDNALDKADILLNNQIVQVSHTTKYGLSKESGMLFTMIRGCKPAIFPIEYAVDKEFEKALFYYSSMDDLKNILLKLANGEINIEQYKLSANEVAEHYTPHNLYGRLVKEKVTI